MPDTMPDLPLPPRLRLHLGKPNANANPSRSLVFARGVKPWTAYSPQSKLEKGDFLTTFAEGFQANPNPDYEDWRQRRKATLQELGAELLDHTSEERLIIGLGLPHPTETGFLLDRLTGSPYLPGSSVKGLLRAAARDVARGDLDLEDERPFWEEHLETVFGTSTSNEDSAARGDCVVYDAFPERWPTLEPDVLTPHYSGYYSGDEKYPGDWEDPVPVTFLTIQRKTKFLFPIRPLGRCIPPDDLGDRIRPLLALALSWLGAGGKTQAGYGYFKDELDRAFGRVPGQETWKGAVLNLEAGSGVISAKHPENRRQADALRHKSNLFPNLPDDFVEGFTKKKSARATVIVRETPERWEIVEIIP